MTTTDDPRDAVHRAVQTLASGGVIGLGLPTTYTLAVLSTQPEALAGLATAVSAVRPDTTYDWPPLGLGLRDAGEVGDYVELDVPQAARLLDRAPHVVSLLAPSGNADSLFPALPEETRGAISSGENCAVRVLHGEWVRAVADLLPAPLCVTDDEMMPATAEELVSRFGSKIDLVLDSGPARMKQPAAKVKVTDGQIEVLTSGPLSLEQIDQLTSEVIVFVCTGNTCRSPMAEGLFRHRLAQRIGVPAEDLTSHGYVVQSAGLAAFPGSAAAPEGIELLRAEGIDLGSHQSQPLSAHLLTHADRIYTMTRQHRRMILEEAPAAADRVRVLSPDGRDISDPIGGGMSVYQSCRDEISAAIDTILASMSLPDP